MDRRVRLLALGGVVILALAATLLLAPPEGSLSVDEVMDDPNEFTGDAISIRGLVMNGSWQEGDTDKNSNVHIWDVKIDDPNLFKAGHDKIVEKYKEDFSGRVVGFGTYDIGRPNGASHWVALSGKNKNDHMKL